MGATARRVVKHALAAPGANTNAFTALNPLHPSGAWEITISLATASIVDLRVTDGTTAYSQALNEGNALAASTLYAFSVPVAKYSTGTTQLTYSVRLRTDGVIQTLIVDEVRE